MPEKRLFTAEVIEGFVKWLNDGGPGTSDCVPILRATDPQRLIRELELKAPAANFNASMMVNGRVTFSGYGVEGLIEPLQRDALLALLTQPNSNDLVKRPMI